MPSVSYIELTTLWNFKGRFPFTVAVVFCDGAFVPLLNVVKIYLHLTYYYYLFRRMYTLCGTQRIIHTILNLIQMHGCSFSFA